MNNKEISKYIALSDRQTEFEFTVKNNYDFSLKRQNIRLDLIEEADGFLVLSYKGLRYPVEIVSRKQNEYEILLNGVAFVDFLTVIYLDVQYFARHGRFDDYCRQVALTTGQYFFPFQRERSFNRESICDTVEQYFVFILFP